jgi:hypothetical protein
MAIVVIGAALSPCFAADSPQYMLDLYAVDPATTNLAPVNPVVNPSANFATVGLVVTTKVPQNLTVEDSGFNMWTVGSPKVVVTTNAHSVTSRQNADGSTTSMYTFNLSVPNMVFSLYLAFSFWAKVVDVADQPAVLHESAQLHFQLLGTATPTPTPSPSPSPTSPPTARPTALPTATPTVTPTLTPTLQPTPLPSETELPTPTQTSTPIAVIVYWLPFIVSAIIVLVISIIIVFWVLKRRAGSVTEVPYKHLSHKYLATYSNN